MAYPEKMQETVLSMRLGAPLLGLDLSFDTHIDDLLVFLQNVNKLRRLFTSIKQTNDQFKKQKLRIVH